VPAVKVDGVWRVTLEEVTDHQGDYQTDHHRPSGDQEGRPSGDYEATTHRPGGSGVAQEQRDATPEASPADPPSIAPLVELVADLTRQNAELAAAAALWQERSRLLSERLAALESGPVEASPESPETGYASQAAQNGPGRVDPPEMDNMTLEMGIAEPVPAQPAQATGWRRIWRRILGHEG
jgi:hypothetical protein